MRYLLGVDGGGTRTRAVLAEETGLLLGQGNSGPSNFHSVGLEMAVHNIKESIRQALAEAQIELAEGNLTDTTRSKEPDSIADSTDITSPSVKATKHFHLALGLAGVGRPRDHAEMSLMLQRELGALASELSLTTDAQIALRGAIKGGNGVVVIAGTGAIALGVRDGQVARAGGWGYLLDDRGSGYDLGRQAITAALRAFDGRGPATALGQLICQRVGIEQITEIIAPVHQGELDRAAIADLVPVLLAGAEVGDDVSREILCTGGQELGLAAVAIARRLKFEDGFAVAGVGGVLSRNLPYLYPAFVDEILRDFPTAQIVQAAFEPVYGALIMAAEQAGVAIEPMIRRWENEAQSSTTR